MVNTFKLIDGDFIIQIEKEWREQLEEHDVNPARTLGAIARVKEIVGGDHKDQYAYAYVNTAGSVCGVALLSHALPRSPRPWLKVLELTLAPALVDDNDPAPVDDLMEIAGDVITEVFKLSADKHKSESVKIYADSILDARILKGVALKLHAVEGIKTPFDASSHGRWLVLERNGEGRL